MTEHLDLQQVYRAGSLDELREAYDNWASSYDAQISVDYGYCGHERVIAQVRPLLSDNAIIIDAGAGSGLVGEAAIAAGFKTIDGFDLSAGMLEIAHARDVYRDLRVGVLGEPLTYGTDTYDAAVSAGVFTPGHAPAHSFNEIIRIVSPGGLICFTLRHDETPPGFLETIDELSEAGHWEWLHTTNPFQTMPDGEPDVLHRIWLFRVL